MDKKKIKYFYFDMDGTLLRDDKVLTEANVLALKKLMDSNFKVGIISGRPDYMVKKELALIGANLPVIAINGAKIAHNAKTLHFSLLEKNVCAQITAFLTSHKMTFLGYSKDSMFYFLPSGKKSKWITWLFDTKKQRLPEHDWKLEPFSKSHLDFAKILVITAENSIELTKKLENFISQFPSVYGVSSQTSVLDIMPRGISKGTGLELLAQMDIIDLDKTIVFGDGNNDIPMFEVAKFSVAMQNAYDKVKKAASMTNKYNNNEDGVANFIKEGIFNGINNS